MFADSAALETLLDLSPLATATLDLSGRVTRWNAAAERLFGWTRDEVIDELHPVARDEGRWLRQHCAHALQAGRQTTASAQRPRRDGSFAGVSMSAAITYGADGQPQGFVAVYAETNKHDSLSRLADGIALEINSPSQYVGDNLRFLGEAHGPIVEVMAVVGRLQRLVAGGSDPSAIWNELEALCRAAERADLEYLTAEIPKAITQAIDGLRLVAQIVTAMKEFSPQTDVRTEVDLNKAVETTMLVANNQMRYVADTEAILDPDLSRVWCLPGPINQVILLLLTRATDAIRETARTTPGIGKITISTRNRSAWVEIEVNDTGAAIPDAARPHVFEPLFCGAGAGLGLAHAIIRQHRGRIWFESEAGRGSSFFVRLPVRKPRQ